MPPNSLNNYTLTQEEVIPCPFCLQYGLSDDCACEGFGYFTLIPDENGEEHSAIGMMLKELIAKGGADNFGIRLDYNRGFYIATVIVADKTFPVSYSFTEAQIGKSLLAAVRMLYGSLCLHEVETVVSDNDVARFSFLRS